MKKKTSLIILLAFTLVFMVACGGGGEVPADGTNDVDVVEDGGSTNLEGEAGLIAGKFSGETEVFSEHDVKITYPKDLEAEINATTGYPSVIFDDVYKLWAQKQGVAYTMEEMTEQLEGLYSEYKDYDLYEATYKGHPCLVFMYDTTPDIDSDATLTIYVYPEDDGMIEISVLSYGSGELEHILNDPTIMAVVNNIDW